MFIDYNYLQNSLDDLNIRPKPKTFLSIIDKSYYEVLVSKYLAYFLDERNTARKIWERILRETAIENDFDFIELLNSSTLESIKTEDPICNESRLDIIIKYSNFWIVIENKVLACESKENQTIDYEKQLKQLNSENLPVKYIYLKPNFNKSSPSNPKFAELTYGDLVSIFKSLDMQDLCDAGNYIFLQDFIKHSEEYFMKNNQSFIDEDALQFYFKNKSKLEYILQSYSAQSIKVRDKLVEELKNAFPSYNVHIASSYIQIYKSTWENIAKSGIHFEICPSNTKFDSILANNILKLRYCVHNEKSTNKKFPDSPNFSLYTKEYLFDTNENIEKSIQMIVSEIQTIMNRFEKQIDDIIAKGPVKP